MPIELEQYFIKHRLNSTILQEKIEELIAQRKFGQAIKASEYCMASLGYKSHESSKDFIFLKSKALFECGRIKDSLIIASNLIKSLEAGDDGDSKLLKMLHDLRSAIFSKLNMQRESKIEAEFQLQA